MTYMKFPFPIYRRLALTANDYLMYWRRFNARRILMGVMRQKNFQATFTIFASLTINALPPKNGAFNHQNEFNDNRSSLVHWRRFIVNFLRFGSDTWSLFPVISVNYSYAWWNTSTFYTYRFIFSVFQEKTKLNSKTLF